jgi:Sec-independent protein translocase protein TatA
MGRNVGLGIKEFKKGVTEGSRNDDKDEIGKAGPADEREHGTTP